MLDVGVVQDGDDAAGRHADAVGHPDVGEGLVGDRSHVAVLSQVEERVLGGGVAGLIDHLRGVKRSGDGVEDLENRVLEALPFSRPFYDEDQFTNRSERFLAGELIREQLMLRLHQELPYALTVEIEEFKRSDKILRIGAIVWVERESQKQIVIGKGGDVLKQVGTRARHTLQELFDEKIFLRLWVKVSHDWSDNERALRQFGYEES